MTHTTTQAAIISERCGYPAYKQLRDAAAVDIPLLDHVIIGRRGADPLGRGYYSFRAAGLL
jgi:hypothetical protein